MASELSNFIEKELRTQGYAYDEEEPETSNEHQSLMGALRVEVRGCLPRRARPPARLRARSPAAPPGHGRPGRRHTAQAPRPSEAAAPTADTGHVVDQLRSCTPWAGRLAAGAWRNGSVPAPAVQARVKEQESQKKLFDLKRGICIGGGILLILAVWALLITSSSKAKGERAGRPGRRRAAWPRPGAGGAQAARVRATAGTCGVGSPSQHQAGAADAKQRPCLLTRCNAGVYEPVDAKSLSGGSAALARGPSTSSPPGTAAAAAAAAPAPAATGDSQGSASDGSADISLQPTADSQAQPPAPPADKAAGTDAQGGDSSHAAPPPPQKGGPGEGGAQGGAAAAGAADAAVQPPGNATGTAQAGVAPAGGAAAAADAEDDGVEDLIGACAWDDEQWACRHSGPPIGQLARGRRHKPLCHLAARQEATLQWVMTRLPP